MLFSTHADCVATSLFDNAIDIVLEWYNVQNSLNLQKAFNSISSKLINLEVYKFKQVCVRLNLQ